MKQLPIEGNLQKQNIVDTHTIETQKVVMY